MGLIKTTPQENNHINFLFSDLITMLEIREYEKASPKFISVFDHWLTREEVTEKLDKMNRHEHSLHSQKFQNLWLHIYSQHAIYTYIKTHSQYFRIKTKECLKTYFDNTYDKYYKDEPIFLIPDLFLVFMPITDHTIMYFDNEFIEKSDFYGAVKNANLYILDSQE